MVEPVRTNMVVMRPSRKRLVVGDVFAAHFAAVGYVFGRVIQTDLPRDRAPMPGANLIYVYSGPRTEPTPDLDALSPTALLVPPLFINRLPWSRGYFTTVANKPLEPTDVLPAVHFWRAITRRFVDETGAPISFEPQPPIGTWGLASFRTFDDVVSAALGIPLVRD